MVKVRVRDDEFAHSPLRFRIRLDYKGFVKPGKLFFGGKSTERAAEENREQQVALLRNIPVQGVFIEDIDMSAEPYSVYDEFYNREMAFAPVSLQVAADSLQDVVRFIAREEFRKIEIIEPEEMILTKFDLERVLFKVSEEFTKYRAYIEKKISSR